jgi:hypothetical protein
MSVLEHRAAHRDSPPPHIYHKDHEVFYVRAAEMRFELGNQDF